jgi:phage major head subunit gpT-like protein
MSKHSKRRMIRAADSSHTICCDVSAVEWVQASAETPADNAPKRFKMRAYTGGPMSVGYYGAPVVIDMAGLTAKAPLPILMNHSMDKLVGHADEVTAGDSNLDLAGVISGASVEAAQVLESSKQGFPWKASVGARPDKMEFVGEGVTTKVNGKTLTGPLYVARKSTLGEVSFVAMAADGKTSAKVAAIAACSNGEPKMNEFEKWVQAEYCLDPATLSEESRGKLQAKYDALQKPAEPPAAPIKAADPAAEIRAAAAAESTRIAAISKLCANHPDIQAQAIGEGWDANKTEVAVLKAELPKAPAIHAGNHEAGPQVIEAALCLQGGLASPEKHYKPEVIEAAEKQYRGVRLGELLLIHARANGYNGRSSITTGNAAEVIRAAFSTHSLTTLLTTAGNKLLLDGFNMIPSSWRTIATPRTVSDFKQVTLYRMTAGLEYEEVGPAGEIKHGTLGQESYTAQAKTYAKMLALTRQDIINDDLGAFNDIRTRLGMGAQIKLQKIIWQTFMTASNAGTFWTAARGNLVTSSALAEAGLNTAVQAFRDMAGPDGNMMGLNPEIVLVPTALEATAKKIYVSSEIRDTTASTKYTTANIYQGSFRPVAVPELGNSAYTGYSATTWYLLTSIMLPVIASFLDGRQEPVIESADADFDTLGIQFRGYHDFGADMGEYRGSLKATA